MHIALSLLKDNLELVGVFLRLHFTEILFRKITVGECSQRIFISLFT